MSSIRSGHLTDDQFTECVIVAPSPESEGHLSECAQCRRELAGFTESVQDFTKAAFAWSEAQPAVSLRAVAHTAAKQSWFAPAAWALSASLVLAAAVPLFLHRESQPKAAADAAALVDASGDSDAQIAEDNQLLRSVNMAIGMNDSTSRREFGLDSAPHSRLKPAALRSE